MCGSLRLSGLTRQISQCNLFQKQEDVGEASQAAHEAAALWIEERIESESE
jgi:hypothetical protein